MFWFGWWGARNEMRFEIEENGRTRGRLERFRFKVSREVQTLAGKKRGKRGKMQGLLVRRTGVIGTRKGPKMEPLLKMSI